MDNDYAEMMYYEELDAQGQAMAKEAEAQYKMELAEKDYLQEFIFKEIYGVMIDAKYSVFSEKDMYILVQKVLEHYKNSNNIKL